jgi:hypothetical protein
MRRRNPHIQRLPPADTATRGHGLTQFALSNGGVSEVEVQKQRLVAIDAGDLDARRIAQAAEFSRGEALVSCATARSGVWFGFAAPS